MWAVMIIAAPAAIGALFMKETSKARILYSKEQKLGTVIPHKAGDSKLLMQKLQQAFARPLHMMLIEASTTDTSLLRLPSFFSKSKG